MMSKEENRFGLFFPFKNKKFTKCEKKSINHPDYYSEPLNCFIRHMREKFHSNKGMSRQLNIAIRILETILFIKINRPWLGYAIENQDDSSLYTGESDKSNGLLRGPSGIPFHLFSYISPAGQSSIACDLVLMEDNDPLINLENSFRHRYIVKPSGVWFWNYFYKNFTKMPLEGIIRKTFDLNIKLKANRPVTERDLWIIRYFTGHTPPIVYDGKSNAEKALCTYDILVESFEHNLYKLNNDDTLLELFINKFEESSVGCLEKMTHAALTLLTTEKVLKLENLFQIFMTKNDPDLFDKKEDDIILILNDYFKEWLGKTILVPEGEKKLEWKDITNLIKDYFDVTFTKDINSININSLVRSEQKTTLQPEQQKIEASSSTLDIKKSDKITDQTVYEVISEDNAQVISDFITKDPSILAERLFDGQQLIILSIFYHSKNIFNYLAKQAPDLFLQKYHSLTPLEYCIETQFVEGIEIIKENRLGTIINLQKNTNIMQKEKKHEIEEYMSRDQSSIFSSNDEDDGTFDEEIYNNFRRKK